MENKSNTALAREYTQECAQEWKVLQNQFDSYEKFSLLIKLINIVLVAVVLITNNVNYYLLSLTLVLWLQDAIWKTFQARIETRILQLEKAIVQQEQLTAFQFNREFLKNRVNGLAIFIEYGKSAVRPTIAFPHCFLALLVLIIIGLQ